MVIITGNVCLAPFTDC